MWHADPRGVLALVAVALCWGLAVVLFRVGLPGSMARRLGLLLVFEGVTLGSSGSIGYLLVSPATFEIQYPGWQQFFFVAHTLGDCAMLALYPAFLAAALDTPLTRPFRGRHMHAALIVAAIALFFFVVFVPLVISGPFLYLSLATLFSFAFVASLHAWWRARPGAPRTRAGIFALAFGFRDICWCYLYAAATWQLYSGTYYDRPDEIPMRFLFYALGTLFAVPLIAYGILRTQLFDIDLRIRWTIKQSTLAAIIVAFVYVISEGADRFLSSELGNLAGLLAAAVVVFFLTPLQRFAERVATAAMPKTENTPEYKAFRKMQIYESAVAEARQEGGISNKERALLKHLRESLGISEADGEAIERGLKD